jgi:hypothetical protein
LGLNAYLITTYEEYLEGNKIDYKEVNKIIEVKNCFSKEFLINNLK